jgi:hypothetical protein
MTNLTIMLAIRRDIYKKMLTSISELVVKEEKGKKVSLEFV